MAFARENKENREKRILQCRLCAEMSGNGIMAFSDQGILCGIQQHVKKYLYITVTMDDKLSKFICTECFNIMQTFHSFASMASQNQKHFIEEMKLKHLNKQETDKEIVNDHDYVTSDKGDEIRDTPKRKRVRNRKKSPRSIKKVDDVEMPQNSRKDNDLLDVTDSNTHETLEIVVDPTLYLESSCESAEHSSTINKDEVNLPETKNSQCLACDFDFATAPSVPDDPDEECPFRELFADCENNNNEDLQEDVHCPICGKGNFTTNNIKLHLRIHRPKGRHACDSCKRIFKSLSSLDRHKVYHKHVQFKCEICQRVYPTQSTLKAHSITHSDLRPHQCRLCEKSFKRNQDLKFHMNQHTGARPYKCIYCPKAFASSGNCFSHRKRMHPDEVERDRNFAATILR